MVADDRLTQNETPEVTPRKGPEFPGSVVTRRGRTGSQIEQSERGYQFESERNIGRFRKRAIHIEASEVAPADGKIIRMRSEVARDIHNRVNELIPLVGDVSFATNLQLLKRDLSRCHDVLGKHPSESNFLSIITLVEAALAQFKLKDYTPAQLEWIRAAIDVGYRQSSVSFDDYDQIRREFAQHDIDTHPRIDLDAFSMDDLTDGEDEEA